MALVFSRWCEYVRDYIYIEKNEIAFIRTPHFKYLLLEIVLAAMIPYPGQNGYILYMELGNPLMIPYSSILCVFSLLRVYFLLKLFKHLTRWTNSLSEYVW